MTIGIKDPIYYDDDNEIMTFRDEYDRPITAHVFAYDGRNTLANYDAGERWAAIIITDNGDGNAKYHECREGETYGITCQDEFIVKQTDSARSMKWFVIEEEE